MPDISPRLREVGLLGRLSIAYWDWFVELPLASRTHRLVAPTRELQTMSYPYPLNYPTYYLTIPVNITSEVESIEFEADRNKRLKEYVNTKFRFSELLTINNIFNLSLSEWMNLSSIEQRGIYLIAAEEVDKLNRDRRQQQQEYDFAKASNNAKLRFNTDPVSKGHF